ncbi:mucoidy inhibitor MuiA family protein [Gymnodinialimonas ulvae]|uniref:mucoidy inhibitor MuiA family protein n=1 Tax=Gymnodinialimonas ulvae TaxID=3126504 RepID=UPI0030ADC870
MKRFLLTTAICATLPFAVHADDILIRADLTQALVFADGAELTRSGTVSLPAGEHRLIVAMPDLNEAGLPQITGPDGTRLGVPQRLFDHPISEGVLDTPAQATARAGVESAEEALLAAGDALAEADAAIRAIDAQQSYVAAILRGGDDGVAMPEDPTLVPQFLATLGAETERLSQERQAATVARRALAEAVTEAQAELELAAQGLQALRPLGTQIMAYGIDVEVAEAGELSFELDYLSYAAGWTPTYELELNSETGDLQMERFVVLRNRGAATWDDVSVTFSTATPGRERRPSTLTSIPARIMDPVDLRPEARGGGLMGMQDADSGVGIAPQSLIAGAASPTMEPVVLVEDRAVSGAEFAGLSVTYSYGAPVSVGPSGEVILPFDTQVLETEMENRAVPRHDATAFLVAQVENTLGEPILPGAAVFFRDGALMGEGFLPLIASGADVEMGFGPLDHLQLRWIDRSLAEGDRGVFTTSTTQRRELAFGVTNSGAEPEEVRILYATPFAEQEDLELDVTLSPRPSQEDVDDQRGVHAWERNVAPGEEILIEMGVEFEFPEGQVLDWRP